MNLPLIIISYVLIGFICAIVVETIDPYLCEQEQVPPPSLILFCWPIIMPIGVLVLFCNTSDKLIRKYSSAIRNTYYELQEKREKAKKLART